MSHYRRANFAGGYYFFTVVTYGRRSLFLDEAARACLRQAIEKVQSRRPFEVIALCLLPEHLHCVWKLPDGDNDFSKRWAAIKALFTREYLRHGGPQGGRGPSRRRSGEAAIWQRRFWEHQIRDESDLQRHIDYIHFNPVKHGLVAQPGQWPWSTYHRHVRQGFYEQGWRCDPKEHSDLEAGE